VADDILSNYQHLINEFTFVMGTKGAFEFKVDDEVLFSKKELGRHAEPGEVLARFKELVGPEVPTYPQTKS
jgi:selenoprotein W-related protein